VIEFRGPMKLGDVVPVEWRRAFCSF